MKYDEYLKQFQNASTQLPKEKTPQLDEAPSETAYQRYLRQTAGARKTEFYTKGSNMLSDYQTGYDSFFETAQTDLNSDGTILDKQRRNAGILKAKQLREQASTLQTYLSANKDFLSEDDIAKTISYIKDTENQIAKLQNLYIDRYDQEQIATSPAAPRNDTAVDVNEQATDTADKETKVAELMEVGENFQMYKQKYEAIQNGLSTGFQPGYIPYEEGTSEYWQEYKKQEKAYNEFIARKYEEYQRQYGSVDNIKAQVDALTGKTDERTWFQKGAYGEIDWKNKPVLENIGLLFKGAQATKADIGENLGTAALGMGEKVTDAAVSMAPANLRQEMLGNYDNPAQAAGATLGRWIANLLQGNDLDYDPNREIAERAYAEAKPIAEEFIAKDLYDEEKIAKNISKALNPLINSGWMDPDKDSVLGEKSDALVQSAGELGVTAALSATGVPWWLVSAASSYGGEVESAMHEGATMDEAMLSGFVTAAAEVLTEKVGGISFGGKTLTDAMIGKLTKGIADKFTKKLVEFGLGSVVLGEGTEEVASELIGRFGKWISYQDDKTLQEMFTSEEAADAYLESYISGFVLGEGNNIIKGLTGNNTQAEVENNTPHPSPAVTPSPQGEGFGERIATAAAPLRNDAVGANNAYEDALALASNADKGTLDFAVAMFRQSGNVSNNQAKAILNDPKAVQMLQEQTGMELPGTAAGNRAAVKNAVASLAQQEGTTAAQTADSGAGASLPAESQPGADIFQEVSAMARGKNVAQSQGSTDAQKNADPKIGTQYQLKEYSQHQKDNWKNSKRIVLYEGIAQFKNFIKNALSGKNQTNKKLYFGAVPTDLAAVIMDETGVNVNGYNLSLAENEIRKINKDHGNEQTEKPRGQRAVTEADYLNIPNVVQSFDSVRLSPKLYEGKPVIEFRKINGNETTVVSAVVSDKRLDLFVQTTYVNKKMGSIATPESEQADSNTPEATGGTAPNEDVTQVPAEGQTADHETNARSALASPSSINTIADSAVVVNPGDSTNVAGSAGADESVGAAPAGFDMTSHLQYEHGTIPEGENPVRPDDLPRKDIHGKDVSYTARTVKGAEVTPDDFVDLLNKETVNGGLSYVKITNDATVQKAIDYITEEGWDAARTQWHADVQNRKTGADMVATGALLLNNAAKAGDKVAWLDILHDYQILGTNTAQGLQAFQILKQLTPSDKLYMARRSIKQMVKDMKLDTEITIDPELETEYINAETDQQRDSVLKKIQKDVARKLPTTFMEKFTALRYVNMLGNLRTQVRNVVGNFTMMGTRAIHNAVATGIETVANKVSGGKVERTRSVILNKDQVRACAKDFDAMQEVVLESRKFNDNDTATGFSRGVQNEKQIFKFKPLEGYRKITNWAMEQGDIFFAKDAYARALAGYLKAKGITETDLSKIDSAVMDDARLFAAKEAQEATFRDTNWLSGWVSKIGRRKDTPAVGKMVSEGVMPFRKTPANVLVRAEEYSPLGVINSVVLSVKAALKGSDITANQVINSWAKSLTGTGLFGLGMLLQSLGLLSAGPDEDENKDGFEDLNGWQDYAITLPDGTNLTIDCFSPSAIPMLMGAQLMKEVNRDGFQLKDIGDALLSIADPLVEMSMLQGVNDTLENIQYADSPLGQLAINMAVSYLTQGLTNVLAGQIERSFERSRMQTFVDKDSDLPDWLQRTLGKVSAKTPGVDYNQIPYINAWGEEEENPSTGLNLVYNLLSPVYFDKGKDDDLTRELNRLNDAQSDINVYPSVPDKTVKWDKQEYNLSKEEFVYLAKVQGQTQKRIVEDLIANEDYDFLSDADKAKAIRYAYDYARDAARGEVIEAHPGITTKWMADIGGDEASVIIRYVATGTTEKYLDLSIPDAAYVVDIFKMIKPESGYDNPRTIQKVETVANADYRLTEEKQRDALGSVLDEDAYEKFQNILALGYDVDDYAASYRIYLDEKAEGGKGTKDRIIRSFRQEFGIGKSAATKLYECYVPPKD